MEQSPIISTSPGAPTTEAKKTRRHPSKACNECKQQKLRCSAPEDHPNACARCRKLGLHCEVQDGFRRVNKRLRSESLAIENEALRQKLEHGSQASPSSASNSQPHPTFATPAPVTPAHTDDGASRTLLPDGRVLGRASISQDHVHQLPKSPLRPVVPSATIARTISGIRLEANEINDIFNIYFTHYNAHLPFLDPKAPPNQYYEESPLLFWAIIGVGARRYSGNPTLLASIADPILHLDWPPLHATPAIVPAIKGLLLLSYFPLPTDSTFKDNSYTLSGMAINLALQIGLHVPLHRQEFTRSKVRYTEDAVARRTRYWFHCIVVHQRAACGLGYPITVSPDRLKKQMDLRGLSHLVPATLSFEMRLGGLLSRIHPLFSSSAHVGGEGHAKFARARMADAFEAELDELEETLVTTEFESLQLDIARLQLRTYYLRDCESLNSLTMAKLATSATSCINLVDQIDKTTSLTLYCPHYIYRMVALAASVLLRMLKAGKEDPGSGYKSYLFNAIRLLKQMSIEDNDGPSRMARIFSRLWTSDKAFRHGREAATDSVFGILVQSRAAMSVLHDTTWWYRELFGSIAQPTVNDFRNSQNQTDATGPMVSTDPADQTTSANLEQTNVALDNGGFVYTPTIWDGPFDQGFELMLDAFPESWPI